MRLSYFIRIFVIATALFASRYPLYAQPGTAAPPGTYIRSCTPKSYDLTTGIFVAHCNGGNNASTWMRITDCDHGEDLKNIAGTLRCKGLSGKWEGGAIPGGDYQDSCVGIYVNVNNWTDPPSTPQNKPPFVLYAKCYKIDVNGGVTHTYAVDAHLDLAACKIDGRIWNQGGQLLCVLSEKEKSSSRR